MPAMSPEEHSKISLRALEIINFPSCTPQFYSDSRRDKGRIVSLRNLYHNTEAG